jgi:hypothetical protein
MKKKKIFKNIQKILLDLKKEEDYYPINIYNNFMFTEPNEDLKKRGRKLIFKLLNLRDKLTMNINNKNISISADLNMLKDNPTVNIGAPYYNTKSNVTGNKYYDNYLTIEIISNVGYILSFSDKRIAFKDKSIYENTIEQINKTFKIINENNFDELYSSFMKETGLARESNLEDLLD